MHRRSFASLCAELLEGRDVPATVFGLTATDSLIQLDPTNPSQTTTPVTVSGLTTGDHLVGIDFSPSGQLFAVATTAAANTVQLYTIDPSTGAATAVGSAQTIPGGGSITGATRFGVDYNAAQLANVIRVVTDLPSDGDNTGNVNNFTVNPSTGAVTVQPDLVFPTGAAPETAIAYVLNSGAATQNTLYGIATGNSPDQLVINGAVNSPSENLAVVGSLGVDTDAGSPTAFDIGPNNTALAALTVGGTTRLYRVDLATGAATATGTVGSVPTGIPLTDLAVAPAVVPFVQPIAVGGSVDGRVLLYTAANGTVGTTAAATVNAFPGLSVQARATTADVNGDGIPDVIAVTGPGTAIKVTVISGVDKSTVLVPAFSPFAGSEDFTGGGFVSAGDLNGDGKAEIVVSPDQGGGPRVTIFSPTVSGGTVTLAQVANFLGIDDVNFRGGARTAVGDVNGDGHPDLAVAAGFLGGPRVALFNGTTLLATPTRLVNDFFAFPGTDAQNLRNGAYVALGDIDGDGKADLIFGGGPGGAPRVFILSGALVSAGTIQGAYDAPIANFFVAGNSTDRGGVRVAAADLDGDLKDDLVVGSGAVTPARVRVYLGKDFVAGNTGEPATFQDVAVFGGAVLADGVYVG